MTFQEFLKRKNIALTKQQQQVVDLLFDAIVKNKQLSTFFLGRATGKTRLFRLLDEYFATCEVKA